MILTMKYYSLLIIASILLISCKKDDTVALPDYKQLEVLTQDGDTVYHVKYDHMKRPTKVIQRYFESIFEYGNKGLVKIIQRQVFDGEVFDSLELLYHYHPLNRLDSIQAKEKGQGTNSDYTYTWRFFYKNSRVSDIFYDSHRMSSNTHNTNNTTFEYLNGNIITAHRNWIENDANEVITYEFDDKNNAFKSLSDIVTQFRVSLLANPLNSNNILSSVHETANSSTNEISEYTYDEDDYPIERRTITFNGETSRASIWKYYYKED